MSLRGRGDPRYNSPDNYSASPLPPLREWLAKREGDCTARGLELSETYGKTLSSHLPAPIIIVADNSSRCIDTATKVTAGLGSAAEFVGTTPSVYPAEHGFCTSVPTDKLDEGVKEMLGRVADSKDPLHSTWAHRQELLTELQQLVGHGVAPDLVTIPNRVANGNYVGGLHVSAEGLVSNFILEVGAGLSVASGMLDGDRRSQLYDKWQPLDVLYKRINHGGEPISTRNGPIIWDILRQLDDGVRGSTVIVAHDLNIDAVGTLLDLSWTCGPFSELSVTPMAGLLFESTKSGKVAIRFVCAEMDGTKSGEAVFGSVTRRGRDLFEQPPSVSELQATLRKKLDPACAAPILQPTISHV
jgi:hypothetical protein